MFALALLKLITPFAGARRWLDRGMTGVYHGAVWADNLALKHLAGVRFETQGLEALRTDRLYLAIANHQSWFDIFTLQSVLRGHAPMLKFIVKRELRWMPLVGLICWAYGYPMMRRHARATLRKHPEKRQDDIAALRRACEAFRNTPATILNFAEGTRFSREKHARQKSPHRRLLKPKAGGVSTILQGLGPALTEVLDLTIVFEHPELNFWDLLCGRGQKIKVFARRFPMTSPTLPGAAETNDRHYQATSAWIDQVWREKDALIQRETTRGLAKES